MDAGEPGLLAAGDRLTVEVGSRVRLEAVVVRMTDGRVTLQLPDGQAVQMTQNTLRLSEAKAMRPRRGNDGALDVPD